MRDWVAREQIESELPELATRIATEFGTGWGADIAFGLSPVIRGPGGEKLVLQVPFPAKGQFTVLACYPDGSANLADLPNHRIRVGISKSIDRIVGDIAKRLLVPYRADLIEAQAAVALRDRDLNAQKDLLAELASRFPALGDPAWGDNDTFKRYSLSESVKSLTVRVGHAGKRVNVDLALDPATAIKVLHLVLGDM